MSSNLSHFKISQNHGQIKNFMENMNWTYLSVNTLNL